MRSTLSLPFTTTMAQNPTQKQAVATASESDLNTLDSGITLGNEELTIVPMRLQLLLI